MRTSSNPPFLRASRTLHRPQVRCYRDTNSTQNRPKSGSAFWKLLWEFSGIMEAQLWGELRCTSG